MNESRSKLVTGIVIGVAIGLLVCISGALVYRSISRHNNTVPLSKQGVKATFFSDLELSSKVLERVDPAINFSWVRQAPATGVSSEIFSIRWDGYIVPQSSGSYTITTGSDDGIRVWIDDQLIINDWEIQGYEENQSTIPLEKGKQHKLRVEYYEDGGEAFARLFWNLPGQEKTPIPTEVLFHE
jgi:hypothetical protein